MRVVTPSELSSRVVSVPRFSPERAVQIRTDVPQSPRIHEYDMAPTSDRHITTNRAQKPCGNVWTGMHIETPIPRDSGMARIKRKPFMKRTPRLPVCQCTRYRRGKKKGTLVRKDHIASNRMYLSDRLVHIMKPSIPKPTLLLTYPGLVL